MFGLSGDSNEDVVGKLKVSGESDEGAIAGNRKVSGDSNEDVVGKLILLY
jgi:hypothetical protein